MATQIQLRRGTTAEHSIFTGVVGEVTVDTTKDTLVIHDGVTVGGIPLLRENASAVVTSLTDSGLTSGRVTFASTGGLLADSANLTFNGTNLTSAGNYISSAAVGRASKSNTSGRMLITGGTYGGVTDGAYAIFEGYDYGGAGAGGGIALVTTTGTTAPITMHTNGAERMRIDSSGNVGIGVPPSVWGTGRTTLEIGGSATGALSFTGSGKDGLIVLNAVRDATSWKYVNTGYASIAEQYNGQHIWYTAPSGTAGTAITFTQAMTLDANSKLTVAGEASIHGITVGLGGGSVANSTVVGYQALQAANSGQGNSVVGFQSMYSNTTGGYNSAFGKDTLGTNTTGSYNTAVGYQALILNTTASNNTAVGYQAAYSTTTGEVTAIGTKALYANTTGDANTAVGYVALTLNTTGTNNTGLGRNAVRLNTTGSFNTGVGSGALYNNTTASNNTAVGYQAGYSNTTGVRLNAFGYGAADANTTGADCAAFGQNALGANTVGNQNAAFGTNALATNVSGSSNSAFGHFALESSTGNYNTAIGRDALLSLSTGSGNVTLGYVAGNTTTTGNYNIYIGPNAVGSGVGVSQEIVLGTQGGASIAGKGANTGYFYANGGGVYQGNNSSTWSTTSDQRLKKNIVDNSDGLNKITAITVRNFEYRLPEEITELDQGNAIKKEGVQLGVIAQELQQVLPECVKQESTGVLSVDTDNLTWYLINAIKELKAEIDLLKGAK